MLDEAEARIQPMEYRPLGVQGPAPPMTSFPALPRNAADGGAASRIGELERRLQARESERRLEVEEARKAAYEQGRQEAETERLKLLRQTATSLGRAVEKFLSQRDAYFGEVEQQVVRLALAIAERILRRETEMDPLLLSGAVRVALNQLGEGTAVKLRIPADEAELWREFLQFCPSLAVTPQVVEDSTLSAGECQLETHLGTVDLGVRAQLVEIERGFFDILERRPAPTVEAPARKGLAASLSRP